MNEFLNDLAKRRTYYGLDNDITLSRQQIQEIVEQCVLNTPSAFNSESARVVLLFGAHHEKLWQIVKDALRKIVPEAAFAPTEAKIDSFAAAAGTILYFDDMVSIAELQKQFPTYKDHFPTWGEQANGMLQSNIWVALTIEGLGASLQHYNPLIDDAVRKEWDIPADWKLIAQMPFGNPILPPDPKENIPLTERIETFS